MPAEVRIIVTQTSNGSALRDTRTDVAALGEAAQRSGSGFSALQEIAVGALRQIGALTVEALGKAAQATAAFLVDSVKVAGDFEAGMLNFQSVAGQDINAKGLEQFRDLFIQIGKEMPVSTADVQKAATELVKGGIDPATVAAGGLKQSLQFAAAAGLDLEQAAIIVAKTVGGWVDPMATAGEKAEFLAHSTDLLAKAANASTVNVDDLALGLYNVQGTAKLAGVSFDETVTALAQLAPSFSSSADAGTSFKTFLARLQPTTESATSAMTALGLYTKETGSVFYDAQGNFVGMARAQDLLKTATSGLSEADRVMALQTIFGQDAIRTAAVFAEQGATGYNHMTDALGKQQGVADMAALKQQGLNTAMDNFKGSLEALQITIGTYVLPLLTELFNTVLAPAVNVITDFAAAIGGSGDAFARLSPAIQGIVVAVEQVITGFGTGGLLGALSAISPPMAAFVSFVADNLAPILAGLASALLAVVVPAFVTWAIAAGAAALATLTAMAPVIVTVAAIGVAVALLVAAWQQDWGGIRTTTEAFWTETGKPIFDQLQAWLSVALPAAVQVLTNFWTGTLLPALNAVWSFISGSVIPLLATLGTAVFGALQTALTTLAAFWTTTLKPALVAVWTFIDQSIIPLWRALTNVEMALLQRAVNDLATFWTGTLAPALKTVADYVSATLQPVLLALKDNVLTPIQTATSALASLWTTTLGPALASIATIITNTLAAPLDWLADKLADILGHYNDIAGAVESLIGWLERLATAINNTPQLPGGAGGGDIPAHAAGTDSAPGGWSLVGERGPELVNLPRGAQVKNASQTQSIMNRNQQITINQSYNGGGSAGQDAALVRALAGV